MSHFPLLHPVSEGIADNVIRPSYWYERLGEQPRMWFRSGRLFTLQSVLHSASRIIWHHDYYGQGSRMDEANVYQADRQLFPSGIWFIPFEGDRS